MNQLSGLVIPLGLAIALLAPVTGCGDDGPSADASGIDASGIDASGIDGSAGAIDGGDIDAGGDAGGADAVIDGGSAGPDAAAPVLGCQPAEVSVEALCGCMANIVCDQIYFCLSAEEIASRPDYWSPRASCVEALEDDCLDDADGGDEYLPVDFPGCVADIATRSCGDFGAFASVSQDFPASCDNLRALDTGLGLDL